MAGGACRLSHGWLAPATRGTSNRATWHWDERCVALHLAHDLLGAYGRAISRSPAFTSAARAPHPTPCEPCQAELLALYRETAARVQQLSAEQAARYKRLEACMAEHADQRPEAASQQLLLTSLAAETRAQVQREVDEVGTALAALVAQQREGAASQADLEAQVERHVASSAVQIHALTAKVRGPPAPARAPLPLRGVDSCREAVPRASAPWVVAPPRPREAGLENPAQHEPHRNKPWRRRLAGRLRVGGTVAPRRR